MGYHITNSIMNEKFSSFTSLGLIYARDYIVFNFIHEL